MGNNFSITLHLKGRYKLLLNLYFLKRLIKEHGWYLQVSGDEWQHHYAAAIMSLLRQLRPGKGAYKEMPFHKLFYFHTAMGRSRRKF